MRSQLVLLVLVGLSYGSRHPAWKENTEYVYHVSGRSLTSLHQLSDQYSGIFLRAKLHVAPRQDGKLQARLSNAEYAQIHSQLSDSWNTHIPESQLNYKQLGISEKPFQIVTDYNVITGLIVEKETTNWEANVIKSIISQLQLDLHGQNLIESPLNILPKNDKLEGVFKTMEETVTGRTETEYEIHRLPEYLIQSQPWLVPQHKLKGDGHVYELVKSKNFTNSEDIPAYHYGFGEIIQGHPTSNRIGQFLTRQSSSHVTLTGKLSKYTIQSSQTVNKIIINPTLTAKEQGSSISALNLTLSEVKSADQVPEKLSDPVAIGNLIYTYENAFGSSNEVRPQMQSNSRESSEESSESYWQSIRQSAEQMMQNIQNSPLSSEEMIQCQKRPKLNQAPESPLLPYFMGYHGRSIKSNRDFDIKQNVEQLAKEVSQDLSQTEKMLIQSTLGKYSMLCSMIRVMDQEEIKSVTQQLYSNEKQGEARLTWVVFRDAVAEAGTGPAFLNIQEWISSKKIENYEAAEIFASMTHAVRVPTEEYLEKLFELVTKPLVKRQEYLNETALLAFTRLLNRVIVNKQESHNQYPIYSFKSFYTKQGKEFLRKTVIPYLSEQLHLAISQADSRKIHVYIRALGNVGHKKILEAFEPYLEGQKQISQFQRTLMVLSMDKLAVSYPLIARSVLYRIYQNRAELPEMRVLAVYQLFRTNPPVEMLQRMAENTNVDVQEEVNAAVKSAIESASQLQGHGMVQTLRNSAEAARPLLTRKQYGAKQSQNLLQDFVVKNINTEFKQNLLQVGSVDSMLPKGVKYTLRGKISGMMHYFLNAQAMVSSIRELTNVLYMQTDDYQQNKFQRTEQQSDDSRYSSARIAEILNIDTTEREQLEGFIYTEMESLQRIWSFDNETIKELPRIIRENEAMMRNGKEFHYTKLKQIKEMTLSVPNEMGFPFLYTYNMPIIIQFEGKIWAVATPELSRQNKLYKPKQLSGQIDAFVTVTTKVESQLSIVTPFDHQVYTAGFDKNAQVHLPLKANVEIDVETAQIEVEGEFKEKHDNARLLHFSSWPYTSRSDLMSLSPMALRPNTHRMKPQSKTHRSFDFVMGKQETGLAFRVWGHHPQQSVNILQIAHLLKTEGLTGIWLKIWDDSSLQQTEASIRFIPEQSSSRKFVLRMALQNQYRSEPQAKDESLGMEQVLSMMQYNSKQRQAELLKYVTADISNVKSYCVDTSLEFEGDKKYEHIFSVAFAKSNVDPRSRLLALYKRNGERPSDYSFEVRGNIPNTNEMDTVYSLNRVPEAKYDVLFQHRLDGKKPSKVWATIDMSRSDTRKKYLQEQPLFAVCMREIQEGNRQLSACQNMTIESNFFDNIKAELKYEDMHEGCMRSIANIFHAVRVGSYPMSEVQKMEAQDQNKITVRVQFEPEHLRQVNLTIEAKDERTNFFNISLGQMGRTIFVPHPVFNLKARLAGQVMGKNIRPTCIIDQTEAQTFSNRTYPLSLGEGWTLMMQYIPQEARRYGNNRRRPIQQLKEQHENFVILVRELAEHKEIKLVFNHPTTKGKTVEIYMQYKQSSTYPVAILVDGQEVEFNENKATDLFDGLVQIYGLPNHEVKLEMHNWFHLIFDGERIKLTAVSDKLHDSIIGLCGRFSGDKYEDFWTPENCIVRSPQKFAESLKIEGKHQNSQAHDCIRKELPLYTDVISHWDVERKDQDSHHIKHRNRYVEENGQMCFTIRPVPQCQGETEPIRTITKNIPVHCITQTKTAYYFKAQIDKGGNPDFAHKPVTKKIPMVLHLECN